MIKSDHSKYNKPIIMLYPGEWHVTKEDILLISVSGSSLVVTLHDKYRRIGGLGQFVLPGQIGTGGLTDDEVASYGITQIEYLIGEFVKLGGNRKDLTANVFGSAKLTSANRVDERVLKSNMYFIHNFFSAEKIPVEHLDISGSMRRKVIFSPKDGRTFRKMLKNNEAGSEIIRLENEYIERAFKEVHKKTEYTLF
jgi:chemotaxis protein CheD